MRRIFLAAICFAALASACAPAGNYERAYYTKQGATYFVEMKGRRRVMAHDPFTALRGRTYEESVTLELPTIEGVIDGVDIPVEPGHLRYTGRVVITNTKMKVGLYYDDNTNHPLPWNGEYTLAQKDRAEPK